MNRCSPMPERRVALVLLAAGEGARFGGDKLGATFNGRPLIDHALAAAEGTRVTRRIVVRRTQAAPLSLGPNWQLVVNAQAAEGIASSIRAGVEAALDCDRIVIALADMPLIDAAHLDRIAQATGTIFTRQADGHPGPPAAFDRSSFSRLAGLQGDRGAASLDLDDARIVDAPSRRQLQDVDCPEDLEGWS
ncbi:nucleotidyltransferase family protein [Sphingomicrobium sp. XHP0235]|uniref:nucleotidyltransferase family protein n=1 Tax=Sphingomicrobium aquimarinum TaxID=3133971 RepID=UPI0031FF31E9